MDVRQHLRSALAAALAGAGVEYRDESPHGTGPLARAAVGPRETCGIRRADSSIACWSKHSGLPTQAPPGTYTDIEASSRSGFCAIAADASLACWDNNLHLYSSQNREKRQALLDAPGGQFTEIAFGDDHACAIRSEKTLTCWGPEGRWITTTYGIGALECAGQTEPPPIPPQQPPEQPKDASSARQRPTNPETAVAPSANKPAETRLQSLLSTPGEAAQVHGRPT